MATAKKNASNAKYDAANTIRKGIKYNIHTDADILEYIETCGTPYMTLVKRAIRAEIAAKKAEQAQQ